MEAGKTRCHPRSVLLPASGFLAILGLWWIVASFNSDLIPTPYQALIANLDYILHPFYQRGPGDLGIGWLLLASLRRVLVGFLLGAAVAIPVGFLIGMSKPAMMALNPVIQIFKPVSPLAWLLFVIYPPLLVSIHSKNFG